MALFTPPLVFVVFGLVCLVGVLCSENIKPAAQLSGHGSYCSWSSAILTGLGFLSLIFGLLLAY